MTAIDIIFLSNARTPELRKITEDALTSLKHSEDASAICFNIFVIESASENKNQYQGTTTIFPNIAFGYHRYMNIGLRAGTAPLVCMCNNDLVFHPGWASALLNAFNNDPTLMSASPYCGFFHGKRLTNPDQTVIAGYQNGIHVAGWCLFARRSIFPIVGPLDERFEFWYCDDDYRKTLEKHHLKHALVTNARVDHLGSRTLDNEPDSTRKDRMTRHQALLFHYKWGHRSWILYRLKQLKYILRTTWLKRQ